MALSRKNDNLYDFIVITENEKYVGTVTIKDLLQKTTEIKIIAAKHQNPLSGLPGNMIIEEKLKQCVDTNLQVTIAYLDIDNFKAYNDVYGFESGDLVIKLLADILKEIIPADGFVGHIGGDDFVTIFNSQEDNDYLQEVDERFCTDTKLLYNHEDIINNCIVAVNRKGELERFPLLALTTVTTDTMKKKYNDIYELTEELAELKKKAKLNKIIRGKN
jgi:diguanylate cyclase (GGDEF)-like protein